MHNFLFRPFSSKSLIILFFLLAVLAVGGCAHQQIITPSIEYTQLTDEFATLLGEAPLGVEKIFPSTPYGGPATVVAGTRYTSGLNQECRMASIQEANRQLSIAVCKGPTGWTSLPAIFEATPR